MTRQRRQDVQVLDAQAHGEEGRGRALDTNGGSGGRQLGCDTAPCESEGGGGRDRPESRGATSGCGDGRDGSGKGSAGGAGC